MKKIKNIFVLALSLSVISSCELNLQQDPNELNQDQASIDFLLNSIMVGSSQFVWEGGKFGAMLAQNTNINENRGNTYIAIIQGQDLDDYVETAYAGILNDAKTMVPLAEEREFFIHAGIAKIFQAFVLTHMVDMFGDIPWTQALDPNNLNPAADSGADIYAAADQLLTDAIANLTTGGPIPTNDFMFSGNAANWITVAKSLQFRNAVATRLVNTNAAATINALIADGDLLDAGGLNWFFPYSNVAANPDSRSWYFGDNYVTGASDYQANHMLWAMYQEKNVVDPRIRYYFYRQTLTPTTDVNELSCLNAPFPAHFAANQPFCHLPDGYWGRDAMVTRGIPPDNLLRTNFGIYPAGGRFDDETGAAVLPTDGMQGAGIEPYMMSFNIAFLRAEAALTLGTTGDARTLFQSAIQMNFDYVRAYAMASAEAAKITAYETANTVDWNADVTAYIAEVMTRYDAQTTDAGRLDIMQQEYQIATFGNGHEARSAYLRTTFPNTSYMQPSESASPGDHMRSFLYADKIASRNSSIDQKTTVTVQVFWDNNDASGYIR